MTWQEALLDIEKRKHILNPEDVVFEARDENSPLHSKFLWDDKVAGHLFRIQQARVLIRMYVEKIPELDYEKECRVFVSLREDRHKGGGYRTLVNVMKDPQLKSKLLEEAKMEFTILRNKYNMLEELCDLFERIDKL